ncbi:TPA: hypothetical protein RY260_005288 [Citrobacter freundii]|nr:hypothetical protein [Citrobacter freundii]
MDKFTKEQQVQAVYDLRVGYTLGHADIAMLKSMARQLLASMEQEPVAWLLSGSGAKNHVSFDGSNAYADPLREVTPLYAVPQLPQPAVAITQHFDTIALDTAKMVMCDVNRRDEFLGGDIQLLSRIQCRIDEACRAAMLQVENHTEQHLDMVDHSGDANENGKDVTLINEGNIPAMQIKPVADLYSITSPTGSETTFTFDASEASSFVGSGWSVQEYVELERYQEAITGK